MLNNILDTTDVFSGWIENARAWFRTNLEGFSLMHIAIIMGVLFLLLTIITFIVVIFSGESKTMKCMTNVYNYLVKHPTINKENLVEFNKIMKSWYVPKSVRLQWQNYMINRNQKPSEFLNEEKIIDKPLKASKYKTTIKFFTLFSVLIAALGFLFGLFFYWGASVGILDAIFLSALTPMIILILTVVVVMILNSRYNSIVTFLYSNIEEFSKILDSACKSMPEFVDYEILFTPKEIRKGIPALQEFLRQRAQKEQEALQNAKEQEIESENYNFEDLGIDGSLVMDKAMKEAEHYLGNRRRYLAEIEQIETEKDMLTRSFDDKSKVSQRKLRDIKENQARLKEKLDLTTNKIIANDIRKQQSDEVKKQQQVEKEISEDTAKFQVEVKKLDDEITKRKEEIEKARTYVENVLKNEFKSYSDKIYNSLSDEVGENLSMQMVKFNKEKADLEQKIAENSAFISERDTLYEDKLQQIEQLSQLLLAKDEEIKELNENITNAQNSINEKHQDRRDLIEALNVRNEQCQNLSEALNQRDEIIKKQESLINELNYNIEQERIKFNKLKDEKETEIHHYYDATGQEFFYDVNDRPYFYDKFGTIVYYDEANKEHLIKVDKAKAGLENEPAVQEQPKQEETYNKPVSEEDFFGEIETEEKPEVLPQEEVQEEKPEPTPEPEPEKAVEEEKPELKPKKEKTGDELSLAERRALKLQKMREAASKPASKPAKKPEAKKVEVKQPEVKQEVKKEPEKTLAQKRAEKLAKNTGKAQAQNQPKTNAAKKEQPKPEVKKVEQPKPQPKKVEEEKPQPAQPAKQKTTSKKNGKMSDAEVFEQAFKDLDMDAFNAKLSSVFEQIDEQATKKKKK